MAVMDPTAARARASTHRIGWRRGQMQFCIGDKVREGLQTGTVTDVGTVLIEVKTTMGISRMVCPWELVRVRPSQDDPSPGSAPL